MEPIEYIARIVIIMLFVGFFPLCALTYYNYRLGQRKIEIDRILDILGILSKNREIYNFDTNFTHFFWSVLFITGISLFGFLVLFFGHHLNLEKTSYLLLSGTTISTNETHTTPSNYQRGALFVYGVGFLGAYLWGLRNIIRRYIMNDLLPASFYRLGIRMIFASILALIIYHSVGGFNPNEAMNEGTIPTPNGLLLITVFLVGMFPQRGVKWITTRVNLLTSVEHPSVRSMPLEMIEGMTTFDKERMEELSIDSCYDLATVDFIPLFIKTPYCSRELIDWILQAKLCVKFGDQVGVLRQHGFRRITDLEDLSDEYLEQLAKDTSLNLSCLQQARKGNQIDENIERLKKAAQLLGEYWEGEHSK